MANTYISELSTGVAAGSNYLVQDDGSTTSKITVSNAVASASIIGSTPMGTTATTLTGAVAEHESDISALNSRLGRLTVTDEVIASNTSSTFTIPNAWRGLIIVDGASNNFKTILVVSAQSNGVVTAKEMESYSQMTVTTGTNTLTIANTSSVSISVYILGFS